MTKLKTLLIISIWLGFLATYLFQAEKLKLPGYKDGFGKRIFTFPLYSLTLFTLFFALSVAFLSDSVTLNMFNELGIHNTGIADANVQNASIIFTVMLGTPIALLYRKLLNVREAIEKEDDVKPYFIRAGFIVAFIAAIFSTTYVLLS
ncbi:hypothetical protein [Nostoc sp. PCC 7107]|uniref:hypothetical protein n=1 Tax=Nostoc sp. PCC 7107 TaxID=317936 RepID=UPI00029EEB09|nr:hypothetical protein [Nostoc sp. PCC 7107]AFY40919.1 hypothetical protein Nos7107_0233 [Nostoc sp. PCC 7107]